MAVLSCEGDPGTTPRLLFAFQLLLLPFELMLLKLLLLPLLGLRNQRLEFDVFGCSDRDGSLSAPSSPNGPSFRVAAWLVRVRSS